MHKQAERALRIIGLLTFSFSLFTSLCYAQNEERLTLTTYYPAPYGTYQQLVATDKFLVDNTGSEVANLADMTAGDAAFMGDVGIGTVTPETKLQIVGGGLHVTGVQVAPSQGISIGWNHDLGSGATWFVNHAGLGGGGYNFDNIPNGGSQTRLMTITGVGDVGIGTANPGAKLEIADGAADPVKYGSVQITRSQTNNGNNQLYLSMVRGGSFVGGIGFVPNTNKWGLFNGNTDDPVLIIDGGNVGVGTTSSGNYKLNVDATAGAGSAIYGRSTSGFGVFGSSTDSYGVGGSSTNAPGVSVASVPTPPASGAPAPAPTASMVLPQAQGPPPASMAVTLALAGQVCLVEMSMLAVI